MRADRFGLLVATELAAEMIANYERGRAGGIELRVESLDEAVWDDVVRIAATGNEKWQVKRQIAAFDADDAAEIVAALTPGHRQHLALATLVPVKDGSKTVFDFTELRGLCEDA